jgi:hypothetical protein
LFVIFFNADVLQHAVVPLLFCDVAHSIGESVNG